MFDMDVARSGGFPRRRTSAKPARLVPLAIALAVWLLAGCQRASEPAMRIGTNVWPGYEPFYLARQQGGLPESDFRLVEFSTSGAVGRAFRNQTIEAACLTLDEVLYLAQAGADPVILLVVDESRGADVVLARPPIRSVAELKGKRVAVEVSAVETYTLTRALQQAGLSVKDVTPVYLPIEKHLSAYQSGGFDAVATFEPARTKLKALGAVEIFSSVQIPGEIVDVLVARRDYVARHPERMAAIRRAWFAAVEELRQSPHECAERLAPREQVTTEQFEASLSGLHFPNEKENALMLAPPTPRLLESATRLRSVMRDARLLDKDVPLERLFEVPGLAKSKD